MGNVYKYKEEEISISENEKIIRIYEFEDYYDWTKVYYKYDDITVFVGTLYTSSTLYREYLEYYDNQLILIRKRFEDGIKYIKTLYDMVNKEFVINCKDNSLPRYDEIFNHMTK